MVLCHSRYLYLEFTLSQSFGSVLRAFERGLEHFGGTTEIEIFDNMRTVVREASGKHARFANERIHEVTGKVPSLVFENEERLLLKPLPS